MLRSKLFIAIRKFIFPYDKLEEFVNKSGKILEVGCGHGHICIMLAKNSKQRQVVGIDPSKEKVSQAKILGKDIKNLKFQTSYLHELKQDKFDSIIIADVLCLMPSKEKLKLLKFSKKYLKKKGTLVMKEIEKNNSLFYYWIIFEEFLAAKVFKFTKTDHDKTYLLTRQEYLNLLKKAGFKIEKTKEIRGILPYPHTVFISG